MHECGTAGKTVIRMHWTVGIAIALSLLLCDTVRSSNVQLTLLNGDSRSVELHSIDQQGQVQLADGPLKLNQLREIRTMGETPPVAPRPVVVELVGQGRLYADSVTVSEDRCLIRGHGMNSEPVLLPLELVTGIQLLPKLITKEVQSNLNSQRSEDRLLLRIDDSTETLNGLLESLDENAVKFTWNGKSRSIPRESLIAISLASAIEAESKDRNCLVRFFDNGSTIWAKLQGLRGDVLELEVAKNTVIQTELRLVQCISIHSELLQFVSDLSPASSEHKPIVTFHRPFQKDRNVSGGLLTLRDPSIKTFEKGIGVASNSLLTYRLNKQFQVLCTTIGIDQETAGRGNCIFVVRGDDKELARISKRGTEVAEKLQLNVEGIQILELIVEAGDDLDLADHANWCDLCLIRK